jgi:hypothetical protein
MQEVKIILQQCLLLPTTLSHHLNKTQILVNLHTQDGKARTTVHHKCQVNHKQRQVSLHIKLHHLEAITMHHQEATTSIEDMIQGLCLGWCCLQFICTVTSSTQTANFTMK